MTILRYTYIIAIFFCASILLTAKAQNGNSIFLQSFQYDKRIHDFGTIQEKDGKVSHTFLFTNKGSETVTINDVNAWCGCTTAQFTKEPVRPGKTAKVTITFDPDHRPGKFSKEAVLMLNGGKYYTRIWVKGNVIGMKHPVTEDHPYAYGSGLYMSHRVLPFPPMKVGEEKDMRLLIANDNKETITVEFIRRPNNRVLQFPQKIVLKPGESKRIYAHYTIKKNYNYSRYILLIPKVNGKELQPLKISFPPTL
ncbi:MAG: DUF1573 domain-containing protein [Prevotella sp.]|nr:DUF1573 domain-containing protein [Prevotella sp.]MBQ9570961.1 DUF1573 domain-containing protein [Prevotella sp.]